MTTKTRTIGYWTATALVAFAFASGGIADLLRRPEVMAGMTHLGYPPYFASILGVWKILGALALLAPGLPRVKEWAYAGIVFDLTGAAVSHAAVGDPAAKVITPLILLAIAAASWMLRPQSRKLSSPEADSPAPAMATGHVGLRASVQA
jgi:uncharacterized membrane protein YphA (DoxX/SURF4 family)